MSLENYFSISVIYTISDNLPTDCYKEREDYYGSVNITESGRVCQHWSSNYPHRHNFQIKKYAKKTRENHCRNFDFTVKPWCFTMDKQVRWEYCNITECPKKTGYIENGQWREILLMLLNWAAFDAYVYNSLLFQTYSLFILM